MRGEDLMVWEPEEDWVLNGYGGLGTGSEVRRDPRRPAARMADSLRAVAVVAGPKWRPARGSLLLNAPRLRPTLRRDPCEKSGGGARDPRGSSVYFQPVARE